jgi:hypothetical protein
LLVWTAYLRGSVDGFAAILVWLLEHQSTVWVVCLLYCWIWLKLRVRFYLTRRWLV